MKIISLNTWGGRVHKPLLEFFEKHTDVDIFCLQEIYHEAKGKEKKKEFQNDAFNLYTDIQKILTLHQSYFRPAVGDHYGIALFVKKGISVEEEGEVQIYDNPDWDGGGNHSRNLQYVRLNINDEKILVANVHGLWNGKGKSDCIERLEQSRRIKEFLDRTNEKKILCGDFNLSPDTESLAILEQGMRNLIKEYNVTSTRTNLYQKENRFADYVFVSPGIEVKDFKVLPDEVSDHSPLYLDIKN